MSVIQREIIINTPVERAFQFVSDTPNLVEVWPSLSHIGDFSRDERGMGSFTYTYQMAGFKYSGTNRDVEYIPNKKIVTKSEGGMAATVTWEFEPVPDGVHITFTGDYDVNIPLVGKVISDRIAALNAVEVGILLQNMKDKLEK
ncbi:MAG: SRPBCC family protein [Anaerolineales bacterium]